MILFTKCKKCKHDIRFFSWETDRVKMSMEKGKSIALKCKKCNHKANYHLNDIIARASKIALLTGLLVFVIGTIIVAYLFGYIFLNEVTLLWIYAIAPLMLTPITIYILIQKEQESKVRRFNNTSV